MLRNQITSLTIHMLTILCVGLFLYYITPILLNDFIEYGFLYATFSSQEKMTFVFASIAFIHVLYYLFGGLFLKPLENPFKDFISTISVILVNMMLMVVFMNNTNDPMMGDLIVLLFMFVITPSIALWLGLQRQIEKRNISSNSLDDLEFELKQNQVYIPEKKYLDNYEIITKQYLENKYPNKKFQIMEMLKKETYVSVVLKDEEGKEGSIYILKSDGTIYYDSFQSKK